MDPVTSLTSNNLHFIKLLTNSHNEVKCLALEELVRISSDNNGLALLITNIDLLKIIMEIIADPSLEIAKYAIEIITNVGKNTVGLKLLHSGELSSLVAKLISVNDTIRFRVYDIIITISKYSKEVFELCVSSGFLLNIIKVLDEDDILIHLNALEMFSDLASFEMGFNYLQQIEVIDRLSKNLEDSIGSPFQNLVVPGYLKFFSGIIQTYPQVILNYNKVALIVSRIIIDQEDVNLNTLIPSAVESIGYFAVAIETKYFLQNLNIMPPILKKMGNMIQTGASDLKVICLNSLARILHIKHSLQDNKILSLTKLWFDLITEEPLKLLVNMCRQPFPDIKMASLKVLSEVASQQWGKEYISDFPALVEFLLDRSVESFKECKEVKYEVVKRLSESNIFDATTMQQLQKFVRDGPFHVDIVTEIALEEAS